MFVEFQQFIDAYGAYGIQGVFTFGLLAMLWHLIKWVKPKIELLIDGHLQLMKTMRVSLRRLVKTAEENTRTSQENVKISRAMVDSQKEIRTDILRQSQQLDQHHQFAVHLAEEIKLLRIGSQSANSTPKE